MSKTYNVSNHDMRRHISLVNRGDNGGIAGSDVRRISTCSDKTFNIMGIDNHQLTSICKVFLERASSRDNNISSQSV